MPRLPLHIDLRFLRDIIVVGTGAACLLSQIMAQKAGVEISGELIVAGVTLLTATPFLWKGDERTDAAKQGKHEHETT